jgi:hypothetical protein
MQCRSPMLATAVRQRVEDNGDLAGAPTYVRLYQVTYQCTSEGCGQTAMKGWYRGEALPKLLNPNGPSVLWL